MENEINELSFTEIGGILPLLEFLAENDDKKSKYFGGIGMYPTEPFEQTISEISKEVENGYSKIDVVKNNNRIIGFTQYAIKNSIGELKYLVMLPEYKNQGYGKLLIERAINYFKTKQIKRIDLGVVYRNDNAKIFYEKYGFKTSALIMSLNMEV